MKEYYISEEEGNWVTAEDGDGTSVPSTSIDGWVEDAKKGDWRGDDVYVLGVDETPFYVEDIRKHLDREFKAVIAILTTSFDIWYFGLD